jgi:hypothetical protein
MRTYATPADLSTWTGTTAPENVVGLLRSASTLVEQATRNALYPTDSQGLPSLPEQATVFRDATCAQAAYWAANDLDPAAGTLAVESVRVASSKSIKGASVSYDAADTAKAKQARVDALTRLCGEAYGILDNAGLVSAVIR